MSCAGPLHVLSQRPVELAGHDAVALVLRLSTQKEVAVLAAGSGPSHCNRLVALDLATPPRYCRGHQCYRRPGLAAHVAVQGRHRPLRPSPNCPFTCAVNKQQALVVVAEEDNIDVITDQV